MTRLTENELMYLMAYVDGQVDDDELPEVLALLERSEEARQIVAQHAALGDWVRTSEDARAGRAGADQIAGNVLAEIDKLGGGKVIEIERGRARTALKRQRVKELGALFAVAAVAAAFWLIPSRGVPLATGPGHTPATSAKDHLRPAPAPASEPEARVAAAGHVAGTMLPEHEHELAAEEEGNESNVEVQAVESPAHPFSIFYVPAATGLNAHSSSVVVWISE